MEAAMMISSLCDSYPAGSESVVVPAAVPLLACSVLVGALGLGSARVSGARAS